MTSVSFRVLFSRDFSFTEQNICFWIYLIITWLSILYLGVVFFCYIFFLFTIYIYALIYSWFARDVNKNQTKKLSIRPSFYFHKVLQHLNTFI